MHQQSSKLVNQFLSSKDFTKLTANQQKYAAEILERFVFYYEAVQASTTPEPIDSLTAHLLKEVILSEFSYQFPQDNKQTVALLPVLKAFISFLAIHNQWSSEQSTPLFETLTNNADAVKDNATNQAQLHGHAIFKHQNMILKTWIHFYSNGKFTYQTQL